MNAPSLSFFACLLLGLGVLAHHPAYAQEPPQPTEQHQMLAQEVGVWAATSRYWIDPQGEPVVSRGTETCKMLGPFWLVSVYESQVMGQPFTGHGQTGYDPKTGEFISTWIDSMSTAMIVSRGKYDEATKTSTYLAESPDAMTGEKKQVRMTVRYDDHDHRHFEVHEGPLGAEKLTKVMEIAYVRKK